MSQWYRMYSESLNDPKVQKLPGDTFKAWVNIMSFAAQRDGVPMTAEDIAFALRLNEQKAAAIIDSLTAAGLLDQEGNGLLPHNWQQRQFKSDVSTERVKRFRQRSTKRFNPVPETSGETAPEAEAETDTESEVLKAAATVPVAAAAAPSTVAQMQDSIPFIRAFDEARVRFFGEGQARPYPNATDAVTAKRWIEYGADLETCTNVFAAICARMAAKGRQPPGTLAYCESAVMDAIAERAANPHAGEQPWERARRERLEQEEFEKTYVPLDQRPPEEQERIRALARENIRRRREMGE